jgi:vacuolar protein sorting-associated protein 13A/C
MFKILGSMSILGNPIGFVSTIGTGMQDFFYKPLEGIVHGPLEGGIGLIKGTGSLVKNTVGGTFGATSNVLSSLSKGIMALTDVIFISNQPGQRVY